ncbi:DNA primase [Xylanibacillus composti]|uniref:DNA primase n=1 Tax=Xylanibacillus composti TaxID=1572762 RepID=A0A8J4H1T1_9BACL|nr:DNA primase [Xylanibacillus composti]MDT9724409.1 DNA primase [Xylanibacillus composti]GIQ68005.1 DNA primase [Xylanibacillus composti]
MNNGNIPEEVIQAVLKAYDIVELVGRTVHLTKQGKNYKGLCPFHSEKTPSFTVSPDKQIFHCFGCGVGGHAIKFVMETESLTFPEAVRQMAEEAQLPYAWSDAPAAETEEQREQNALRTAHEWAAKWYHHILMNTEHGQRAASYLRERGFTDKLAQTFQLGYAPAMRNSLAGFLEKKQFSTGQLERGGLARIGDYGAADLFRDRIMFPIHDARGRVCAFSGRTLDGKQPKYLNTPETPIFAKSRILYNLHQAKTEIRRSKTAVLFEGYADVIKSWGAGVLNGIATMGTALTEEHVAVLKRVCEEVVICYDGDDAGQAAAMKCLPLLARAGIRAKVAMLPPGLDPDEYIERYGSEAFVRGIVEAAAAPAAFRLHYARRKYKLQTEEGKAGYLREASKIVASLPSPIERELLLKELAGEFEVSFETLKQESNEVRQELEKKKRIGDKNDNSWNNVWNDRAAPERAPALLPAYINAERHLLAHMMHSKEVTLYVQEHIGDAFNVERHAALAAYLYAFFAEHEEPDFSRYLATLDNPELENAATAISMMAVSDANHSALLDDYIHEIRKAPALRELEKKKREMVQAERSGNLEEAMRLGAEIIALKSQLKST